MSQIEDAALTIERLLRKQMRLIMYNGALGAVTVSAEYPHNEALKSCEGQVTVSLAESLDQKLDLAGKTRRQTSALRVNVWATDNPAAAETGKALRSKIVSEVNRIILQNRNKPNETTYDYCGKNTTTETSKAFSGSVEAPPTASWTEISDNNYQALWYSDDNRCQLNQNTNGGYAVLLFGFKIESRPSVVQKIVLTFEGYGNSPNGDGVIVKVWNNTEGSWGNERSRVGDTDATVTITLASNAADFVDNNGYVWLLARTTYPSNGTAPATLFCDYTNCNVTVNGITYCDITGKRNLDRVDIKPPIYRTEFTVKTTLIENIGV